MSIMIKKHKKNLFFLVLYKRESYKTIALSFYLQNKTAFARP